MADVRLLPRPGHIDTIDADRPIGRHPAHPGPRRPTTSRRLGTLAVGVSAIGFGLSPLFATRAFAAGVSPISASFVRVAMMMLLLSPFAPRLAGWGRRAWVVAGGGAISMLGFAGFYVALDRAPVAAATVVYYTYPVVVLVLSSIVWRRRMHAWEAVVCTAVLIGVALAVGPISMSGALLVALAPACAAPIGWGVYLLVLSGPAADMPTLPKVFAGAVGGVAVLLPLTLLTQGWRVLPATSEAITSVAMLTACTLAIPALLVTWGAARSGERATAMLGSVEFVVAVVVGWLFLGDQLTGLQILGVGLVLCAALFAGRRSSRSSSRSG
jgi:drug/metabolite transporter (DMT)-like permease